MANQKPADAAWMCIVQARGHVQGKVFYMSPGMLAAILFDRGETEPVLKGRFLYGVPVVTTPVMLYGSVKLGERRW